MSELLSFVDSLGARFDGVEEIALPVLGDWILQSALVVLAAWGLIRLLRVKLPLTRYSIWLAALAGIGAMPLPSMVFGSIGLRLDWAHLAGGYRSAALQRVAIPFPSLEDDTTARSFEREQVIDAATATAINERTSENVQRHRATEAAFTARLHRLVFLTWLLGVMIMSAKALWSCLYMLRIEHGASEVKDRNTVELFHSIRECLQIKRKVILCSSPQISLPTSIGAFRPRIIMPAEFESTFSKPQIEAAITHELSHVKRRDCLVSALQSIIGALLFFHPLIWFLNRRLRIEREYISDDFVIQRTNQRVAYARFLFGLTERMTLTQLLAVGKVGISRRPPKISRRIEMILDEKRPIVTKLPFRSLVILLAFCLMLPLIAINALGQQAKQPGGTAPTREREVIARDWNRDGRTDCWIYRVNGKTVRVETDRNRDGKPDRWYYYKVGEKVRVKIDEDFDGKPDVRAIREGPLEPVRRGKVTRELDTNGDGQTDCWVYYEDRTLVRKELDLNFDGKIDGWVESKYGDGSTQAKRIASYDEDGDGRPDTRREYMALTHKHLTDNKRDALKHVYGDPDLDDFVLLMLKLGSNTESVIEEINRPASHPIPEAFGRPEAKHMIEKLNRARAKSAADTTKLFELVLSLTQHQIRKMIRDRGLKLTELTQDQFAKFNALPFLKRLRKLPPIEELEAYFRPDGQFWLQSGAQIWFGTWWMPW